MLSPDYNVGNRARLQSTLWDDSPVTKLFVINYHFETHWDVQNSVVVMSETHGSAVSRNEHRRRGVQPDAWYLLEAARGYFRETGHYSIGHFLDTTAIDILFPFPYPRDLLGRGFTEYTKAGLYPPLAHELLTVADSGNPEQDKPEWRLYGGLLILARAWWYLKREDILEGRMVDHRMAKEGGEQLRNRLFARALASELDSNRYTVKFAYLWRCAMEWVERHPPEE